MLNLPVYLDYNATTPCDRRIVEAMVPMFTSHFGNAASRSHPFGWQAQEAIEIAREQVAALIGAQPVENVFTSGATEAVNLALKGVFETYAAKGKHIVTVASEHKAVLDTCLHLEKSGADITYLPVRNDGMVNIGDLVSALRDDTILISVMYANNETGVVQPIKEIGAIAKKHDILFFTDATQAAGKIPVNVVSDDIDLMAFSSHKMYGPKGVGALYVRRKNPRVRLTAQIDGGGHERGMRSGTLNVPGIVGFGKASEISKLEMSADAFRSAKFRDKLESTLLKLDNVYVNGSVEQRLPHVTNLSFGHVDGDALMTGINKQIAVSSGAACTSASMEPSHVLRALGLSDELAHSSLRFSVGRFTTEEEIDFAIQQVSKTVIKLREILIL